jgi:GNAT superfamily N-acetyltransferase
LTAHARLTDLGRCAAVSTIRLRPMNDEEYAEYRPRLARDFADEMVEAGEWLREEALRRATEGHDRRLPEGLATPGMVILVAETDSDGVVGRVWIELEHNDSPEAWINDIEIDAPFRGRGHGRELLIAAEEVVRGRGIPQIGLNVFAWNETARRLYASSGYEVSSMRMRKSLD